MTTWKPRDHESRGIEEQAFAHYRKISYTSFKYGHMELI